MHAYRVDFLTELCTHLAEFSPSRVVNFVAPIGQVFTRILYCTLIQMMAEYPVVNSSASKVTKGSQNLRDSAGSMLIINEAPLITVNKFQQPYTPAPGLVSGSGNRPVYRPLDLSTSSNTSKCCGEDRSKSCYT